MSVPVKSKKSYFCQSCGYESPKWLGKCPACGAWNTFVEELIVKADSNAPTWRSNSSSSQIAAKPTAIQDIVFKQQSRLPSGDLELDRVLGGGIVPGSMVLIGGEPGIGKSTLMLQIALVLAQQLKILYVSGEESETQIRMRAERLSTPFPPDDPQHGCYVLTETQTQAIFKQIEILQPDLVIIDSIQTLTSSHIDSAAGSISQVKECTSELLRFAKESATPVILIGHITKDGQLAGPKVLEHMVDTVLQFEGDRNMAYRILRTTKNRFGSTSELGIYEMQGTGLREVSNPSEILISHRDGDLSGVSIGSMLEGNRPLMIEIQSLVSPATYGTPQRTTTGFDTKRLNMLLAVLEKRGGFKLGSQDVFLNIAGGLKVEDPAIDLSVCASIISSYQDIAITQHVCFAAEIGLGGEIRTVNRLDQRILEAQKLGFKEIFVSKFSEKSLPTHLFTLKIHFVSKLDEVWSELFG